MKRISVCLFVLALLLIACVPTPEVDAVKQKDTVQLIDTVLERKEENGSEALTVKERMPERLQCDFYTDAQNVHVTSDLPIHVLTEGVFPMLRVERRGVTAEERCTLATRVFGTEQLYLWQDRELTKSEVAQGILIYTEHAEKADERKAKWMREGWSEADCEAILARERDWLESLKERFHTMTDDDEPMPFSPWDGKTFPDTKESCYYLVDRDRSGATMNASYPYNMAHLSVSPDNPYEGFEFDTPQGDDVLEVLHGERTKAKRIDPADYDELQPGASISARQAAEKALSLVDGMGDFAVTSVYWTNDAVPDGDDAGVVYHWGYSVSLSPVYEGAASVSCSATTRALEDDNYNNDSYVSTWGYESIDAWIDRDGTLLSFGWHELLKVTQILSMETPLLSFEEIMRILTQQLNRKFGWETAKDGELTENGVQLGLLRIREKNDMEHGLLVPVWFFTGTFAYAEAQRSVEEYGSYNPLLIINAIDGSIIDPWLGY